MKPRLTALSVALSGTAIASNVVRPPNQTYGILRGAYGIGAGLFSLALGATSWESSNSQAFKAVNTTLGVASIGYGVYELITAIRRSREQKAIKMTQLPAREFASFISPTGGNVRANWRF